MATGYVPLGIPPVRIVSATTTTIFTVPANHKYILKGLSMALTADSSTATTAKVMISDNAGANPKVVTPTYTTGATTGNMSFANPAGHGSGEVTPANTNNSSFVDGSLFDLVLEAGQVLQVVSTGTGSPSVVVNASVVDYTI